MPAYGSVLVCNGVPPRLVDVDVVQLFVTVRGDVVPSLCPWGSVGDKVLARFPEPCVGGNEVIVDKVVYKEFPVFGCICRHFWDVDFVPR